MGLSPSNLLGLKAFPPSSILDQTLDFFESMKYETKDLRDKEFITKSNLLESFSKRISSKTKNPSLQKGDIEKNFNEFTKKLDNILFLKDSKDQLSEIFWDKIDGLCDLLRLIERSDERKIRWALYYLFSSGKKSISVKELSEILANFSLSNIDKTLKKIIKEEIVSGLDVSFDGKNFVINHELGDKLVGHYLADAIEEPSRRSPGELEDEILNLLDEGSYSNQEIAKILSVDEAMISREMGKLRDRNKIVLSSFGKKGARFFTTNCDDCPFGTTKASCRKEALSYLIGNLKEDYGIDLTANDFDDIATNQAILKLKRIFMMARKEKNTKLEQNLNENLSKILSSIVDHALEVKSSKSPSIPDVQMQIKPIMTNLPTLYQLGLQKGAKSGINLMDEILRLATKSIKQEDRIKIRKHAIEETNKFLKDIGVT